MSADVLEFNTFELSGKGLLARPHLLNSKVIAFQADIDTIDYAVYDRTNGGAPITGSLDPTEVMFTTVQPWDKDKDGYTFWWPAPGTLWPSPNREYRIIITFTIKANHSNLQLRGKSFRIAFEANTKSSSG